MNPVRKRLAIVALLAVIVVALAVAAKTFGLLGDEPKMPPALLAEAMAKIDMESCEIVTLPRGEWEKLGADGLTHRYKNSKTGKYTMVDPMPCAACGETIPFPQYSNEILAMTDVARQLEEIGRVQAAYICPKCGKKAIE